MGMKKKQVRHRVPVPRAHKNETAQKAKNKIAGQSNQPCEMKDAKDKTLIIAEEIKIARLLANMDKKIRDRVLKRLKKWLTIRSQNSFKFTDSDFMYLWKGLFYCMWLSDRMLVQEELAQSISELVHCLKSMDTIVLYTSCALTTLAIEWFGLDQYRMDKFSMLTRRILRQTFVVCKYQSWDLKWVTNISEIFEKLFLNPKASIGFNLHVTEIYLEELAKVSNGNLSEDAVLEFVKPFIVYLATSRDEGLMKHIMRHIFRYLIYQSEVGMDYTEKFEAWRNAGFPCVSMDDMQKVELEESDENLDNEDSPMEMMENLKSKPMDPRAGRVNVDLPQLPFDASKIAEKLNEYTFYPSSSSKSRRQLLRLINEFRELAEGTMPLGVKKVRKPSAKKSVEMNPKKGALRLLQFEKELFSDKLTKKQKKERNRKLKSDAADESFLGNMMDENTSEPVMDLETDSENDTIDVAETTETSPTNSSADVPSRKRKNNKHDKPADKCKINEDEKEKPEIKALAKSKIKKIKLNAAVHTTDKNVKSKAKVTSQISHNKDQQISTVAQNSHKQDTPRISEPIIKYKKSVIKNDKVTKKLKTGASRDNQKLSSQIKKQLDEPFPGKKKVMFGLSRNTAQHTSEYIQQVRNSPSIPFDANKKPLASVLKVSPFPSPINPFYEKKFTVKNQRI